jgi:hypothetical protein
MLKSPGGTLHRRQGMKARKHEEEVQGQWSMEHSVAADEHCSCGGSCEGRWSVSFAAWTGMCNLDITFSPKFLNLFRGPQGKVGK